MTKEPHDVVISELKHLAKGVAILYIISLAVLPLIGYFNYQTVLGLLVGSVYSLINFFLIGLSVENAVQMESSTEVAKYMNKQYGLRYLLTAVVIIISIYADFINPFGVMISIFFPKLVIFFNTFMGKEAN